MIAEATGIPVRYEQFTDGEAAAISPEVAEVRKRWQAGHPWHADIDHGLMEWCRPVA